jgi:rhodanese-related sulfurtransferase
MSQSLPQLLPHALAAFVQSSAGIKPVLLDVREPWEVQTASMHLSGVTTAHIPMQSLPSRVDELDRAQPVLVLCHHGVRSLQCVAWLQRQGFAQVYNIAGGIDAFAREVDTSVPLY